MHRGYWDIYGRTHVYLGDDEDALVTWSEMMDDPERRTVKGQEVENIYVSTVFLGVDHGFSGEGPPILFETMCFTHTGGDERWNHYTSRYATWDEAVLGHRRIVRRIKIGAAPR